MSSLPYYTWQVELVRIFVNLVHHFKLQIRCWYKFYLYHYSWYLFTDCAIGHAWFEFGRPEGCKFNSTKKSSSLTFYKRISTPNEIVILSNNILDCEGSLILSGLQKSLKITATKYRANVKRKRLPIGNTNFSIAKVEGSCLWRVWSARRGGSFQLLDSDNLKNGYYEPKFIIRAIELLD